MNTDARRLAIVDEARREGSVARPVYARPFWCMEVYGGGGVHVQSSRQETCRQENIGGGVFDDVSSS